MHVAIRAFVHPIPHRTSYIECTTIYTISINHPGKRWSSHQVKIPKARQTCTRCFLRRQECDRHQPCRRCVAADLASSCTRTCGGQYDPSVHRHYPSLRTVAHKPETGSPSQASEQSLNHGAADTTAGVTTIGGRSHTASIAADTFRQRPSMTDKTFVSVRASAATSPQLAGHTLPC